MGIRYRKRIKLFPGLHLNLSKSGISFNLGRRGANFTIGNNGVFSNFGIPGSGFSYRSRFSGGRTTSHSKYSYYNSKSSYGCFTKLFVICIIILLFAISIGSLGNVMPYHEKGEMANSFLSLVISIISAFGVYYLIKKYFVKKEEINESSDISENSISKPYIPPSTIRENNIKEAENAIRNETNSLKRDFLTWYIEYEKDHFIANKKEMPYLASLSAEIRDAYNCLCSSYLNIRGEVWFINEMEYERTINNRKLYSFKGKNVTSDNKDFLGIHIEPCTPVFQTNKSKLYFFPTVLVEEIDKLSFNLIPYEDLNISLTYIFSSRNSTNCTGKVVGYYWKHMNSDGSKDSRFKENPQINIYQYGCLKIGNSDFIFVDQSELKQFNKCLNDLIWAIKRSKK